MIVFCLEPPLISQLFQLGLAYHVFEDDCVLLYRNEKRENDPVLIQSHLPLYDNSRTSPERPPLCPLFVCDSDLLF